MTGVIGVAFSSSGAEYEVKGTITQEINYTKMPVVRTTNEFTVYVRDCAWLIQTVENDGNGHSWQREVGSTNGVEIYELNGRRAFISDTSIPVELLDKGVDGHLWLMFASQCYWGSLHTDQLTPVYDWKASVGANPDRKVTAEWDLLNGPGSLPREVRYLGEWDETNGLYRATGTNSVSGMLIPSGFVFEERNVGSIKPNTFIHEMALRKRVEAAVTSVQAVCSRKNLMPDWGNGELITIDWRLKKAGSGHNVPSYFTPESEKWPSVELADKLVKAQHPHHDLVLKQPASNPTAILIVMCVFLVVPPIIYFALNRPRKH
jgi:hypothetical protein